MTEDKQDGFSFQLQRFADGGTDGGTEGQENGGKAPADVSAGQEGGKPADESPKADEAAERSGKHIGIEAERHNHRQGTGGSVTKSPVMTKSVSCV